MKKIPISFCLVVLFWGLPFFAEAREWSFLNYQSGECELPGESPASMDEYLRGEGMIPRIEKFNNDQNELERVDLKFRQLNGEQITLRFFPKKEACAKFRLNAIKNGTIINKDDLR